MKEGRDRAGEGGGGRGRGEGKEGGEKEGEGGRKEGGGGRKEGGKKKKELGRRRERYMMLLPSKTIRKMDGQKGTHFVMTMETASFSTLSPNTSMLRVGLTSKA